MHCRLIEALSLANVRSGIVRLVESKQAYKIFMNLDCRSLVACNVTGWRSADNSAPSRPATEVDYLF